MTTRDTFDLLRSILRECEFGSWLSSSVIHIQTLNGTLSFKLFRKLREEGIVASFLDQSLNSRFDSEADGDIPEGTEIDLQVPRAAQSLVVCRSLADLLSIEGSVEEIPEAFILIDSGLESVYFCKGEDAEELPSLIESYIYAVKLWAIFCKEAHHVDRLSRDLLYFSTRRTQIAPGFTVTDLQSLTSIDPIKNFLRNEENSETRKEIFSAVISDYLCDHEREDSFAVILRSVKIIGKRLREGLAIYLAANSPAKLAATARSEYLVLSEKLDKIISSIEVKSLAIPAGLLLCAKEAEKGAFVSALNFVLFTSVGVFIHLMYKVAATQNNVLDGLQSIIGLTHDEFKNKGLDEANTALVVNFSTLSQRISSARVLLEISKRGSWAPLIGLIIVAFFGHPPAHVTATGASPITVDNASALNSQSSQTNGQSASNKVLDKTPVPQDIPTSPLPPMPNP